MAAVFRNPTTEQKSSFEDSFTVIPRNCDTAVVYWNLSQQHEPLQASVRLCLQINSLETDAEELIILHRGSGHFIVPLLSDDREYTISLGWSDALGFRPMFEQQVKLPDYPQDGVVGAMSSSMSFRGAHFWPKGYVSSVN